MEVAVDDGENVDWRCEAEGDGKGDEKRVVGKVSGGAPRATPPADVEGPAAIQDLDGRREKRCSGEGECVSWSRTTPEDKRDRRRSGFWGCLFVDFKPLVFHEVIVIDPISSSLAIPSMRPLEQKVLVLGG